MLGMVRVGMGMGEGGSGVVRVGEVVAVLV